MERGSPFSSQFKGLRSKVTRFYAFAWTNYNRRDSSVRCGFLTPPLGRQKAARRRPLFFFSNTGEGHRSSQPPPVHNGPCCIAAVEIRDDSQKLHNRLMLLAAIGRPDALTSQHSDDPRARAGARATYGWFRTSVPLTAMHAAQAIAASGRTGRTVNR
jgi:hypothetical protein